MDSAKKNAYPREIRTTVELLLDTEKKIEVLRNEIESLGRQEGPKPSLRPAGAGPTPTGNTAAQKAEKQKQIDDLTNRTLQITDLIAKNSDEEIKQRVTSLKKDWQDYIEPAKSGEDKELLAAQKRVSRVVNKDWEIIIHAEAPSSPSKFEENKEEIDGRRLSYLDKARGLKSDYAYLDKPEPELSKEPYAPEVDDPEIE